MLVRGVELAVRDEGDAAGRPVVWCHGLLTNMAADDEMGVFAPRPGDGVRVVRYDARGHGDSHATKEDADYKWSTMAEDMLGVLDGIGVERAVLGGASMGCATAVHAALRAPERVEGLLLVIPPTAWESRKKQATMYRAGSKMVQVTGLEAFIALGRATPPPEIWRGPLERLTDTMFRGVERIDAEVAPYILRGAAKSDMPAKDQVATIDVPTLILAWDTDPGHPASTANELERLLPKSTLVLSTEPEEVLEWPAKAAEFVRSL